jgi:nucleotide-binding universal stress UspA family protein
MARATGATVGLLRVVANASPALVNVERDRLERIGAELSGADLTVNTAVLAGEVAEAILTYRRAVGADLIIMRTHGRSGITRAVLGSASERVLAESQVPVMLLRAGDRRLEHVRMLAVPVDGSPGGAVALGTAVALAQATGAGIKVIDIAQQIPPSVLGADGLDGYWYYDPAWDEDALIAASAYAERLAERLRAAGLVATAEAQLALNVHEAIVATADKAQADLIVMSTHALTGPQRALLGSVADAVVRSAHCPVLLVHRADEVFTETAEAEHQEMPSREPGGAPSSRDRRLATWLV